MRRAARAGAPASASPSPPKRRGSSAPPNARRAASLAHHTTWHTLLTLLTCHVSSGRASRGYGLDAFATAYLLLGSTLHSSGALGTLPGKAAALTLFASLAVRLLRFRRWADETPHALRFFAAFGALLAWLLLENCAIWCVTWHTPLCRPLAQVRAERACAVVQGGVGERPAQARAHARAAGAPLPRATSHICL